LTADGGVKKGIRNYHLDDALDLIKQSEYGAHYMIIYLCIIVNGNTEVIADGSKSAKDKQAWVSKGDALNRMGNFSEAITAYDTALKIDPNYVNALDGKGWSLNELGNYTQAIVYLDKALKIDPSYKWSLSNIGWSLNGLGNYTQAIVYLDKALKIDPNHLDGLVFKAQALYNTGNYTGAKYYSEKAFEIDPKSPALKRLPEVFRKSQ
jgi:tetratricopeptide (TPR) repeat protein